MLISWIELSKLETAHNTINELNYISLIIRNYFDACRLVRLGSIDEYSSIYINALQDLEHLLTN